MSAAPTTWMPLDVGAYLADTMDLSTEQHGAYLLLIMHYWKNREPIKNHKNSIKNVCKISSKSCEELLSRFFVLSDGFWYHKRIDTELAKAIEIKDKRSNQTAAATAARLAKTSNVTSHVTSNVTSLHAGTPTPLPLPSNKTPSTSFSSCAEDFGVLKNLEAEENGSRPYDVVLLLSDDGFAAARAAAPGWDVYHLAKIYNQGIRANQREKPRSPDRAFPGWCAKYTKGKRP